MKIWRAVLHDPHGGALLSWGATKREAIAASRALHDSWPDASYQGCDPHVFFGKAGLIEWLNSHFTTDNG